MSIKLTKAITTADDLVEFLENHPGHFASVYSVFPHAVNLLIREDELVTLTNQDNITPMGLIVDSSENFTRFLRTDEKVTLNLDCFTAENSVFTVNLRDTEVWETGSLMNLVPDPGDEIAANNFQLTKWLENQPALGLLPLLPRLTNRTADADHVIGNLYSRYIADDLAAFTKAIDTPDWDRALNIAKRLVGFGMGSTPSCDDFLAAYLVVFKMANALNPGQYPWVWQFTQAIANEAKNRTTLISANMLRHAGDGKICRSHQRLIQACLFNNKSDLLPLAKRVLQHGATSGGDFLLGLVCALNWYRNTMMDLPKKGEQAWVEPKRLQPVPNL